jgi:hypothetical protein
MPGNMFIPPPQRPNNPMMGLLTQLALMKVQHDWSMEERQLALEAKKVEAQEAKAEVRSKEKATASMEGTRFETPSGPVAGAEAYKSPEGSYYEPRYGQNVTPANQKPETMIAGGQRFYKDKTGWKPLKDEKAARTGSLIEQYQKSVDEFEAGKGPNPGPWDPWLIRNKQAGAVRMGTEEKIDLAEKNKVVDAKAFIQTPGFVEKSVEVASKIVGKDDWQDAPKWKKEEMTFKAADEAIKNIHKDEAVYFGEADGIQGWFAIDKKTKKRKLIRQWGNVPKSAVTTETVRSH